LGKRISEIRKMERSVKIIIMVLALILFAGFKGYSQTVTQKIDTLQMRTRRRRDRLKLKEMIKKQMVMLSGRQKGIMHHNLSNRLKEDVPI